MKKTFYMLSILLVLISCGIAKTKYNYYYETGKYLDLSKGKWILNKVYTNYDETKIYDIALEEFGEILGDSLYEISTFRNDRILAEQYPFEPSVSELKEIKLITNCDYLINVKSNILKNEGGSLSYNRGSQFDSDTNRASSTIKIYDLNALVLVSDVSVTGSSSNIKKPNDDGFTYMSNSTNILVNGLTKLIKKYKKHRL
ncbi:MAG: hypothetical protein HF967_02860 [Methanosarcinales archaeon]|nr:hypothetical protein [Methanosarcinales archaeon]